MGASCPGPKGWLPGSPTCFLQAHPSANLTVDGRSNAKTLTAN